MLQRELSAIREVVDELDKRILNIYTELDKKEKEIKSASRNGQPWSSWEKDFVTTRFYEFIDDSAMKLGRTKLSIAMFISRHISNTFR